VNGIPTRREKRDLNADTPKNRRHEKPPRFIQALPFARAVYIECLFQWHLGWLERASSWLGPALLDMGHLTAGEIIACMSQDVKDKIFAIAQSKPKYEGVTVGELEHKH
jgi:hypothetical protein